MAATIWRPSITVSFEADGTLLELIPLGPRHRQTLAEAFGRLSDRSRYLRFMAPVPELSESDLSYLTDLDMVDRFAWALLVDGQPGAVGRFIRTGPAVAEVAVTVLDEYQGRGIGALLVQALAVVAGDTGLETLEFEVLAENRAMLSVLERLGAELGLEDGIFHGRLQVSGVAPPPVAPELLLEAVRAAREEISRHPEGG